MKLDKQIRYWAQLVNESEDYQIDEKTSDEKTNFNDNSFMSRQENAAHNIASHYVVFVTQELGYRVNPDFITSTPDGVKIDGNHAYVYGVEVERLDGKDIDKRDFLNVIHRGIYQRDRTDVSKFVNKIVFSKNKCTPPKTIDFTTRIGQVDYRFVVANTSSFNDDDMVSDITRKRIRNQPKPNLPKESEEVEEAQHRDDGSVLVSFTIPTENGVSQVQFRKSATEFLDWMTKIDEEEKKQDILLDLSQKDETSFELSKPITINIKSL